MNRLVATIGLVLFCAAARGQQERVIVIQHADSMVGRVINEEDVRELIGHVLLTEGTTRLTCDRALQFIARGFVLLTGDVIVRDDSMTLKSPRASYDRRERTAEAFDSVVLDDGMMQVTSLYGKYRMDQRTAFFRGQVTVADTSSSMACDSLDYERATKRSRAYGRVRVYNPSDRVTMFGGRLDHDPVARRSVMTVDPLLVQVDTSSGGRWDTLQVRARVLESLRDTLRVLIATDSVKIVRTDLAGMCDRAKFFTSADSMTLRGHPVLWQEETQVSGDSINLYLRKRKLQRLLIMGAAAAVSVSDSLHRDRFDQATGDTIAMYFALHGLDRTEILGRATSVYHAYDDTAANGLNKSSGDKIVMTFTEGKASRIAVIGGVEGMFIPENMLYRREQEYALPGCVMRSDRPLPLPVPVFVPPPLWRAPQR
jgi:lipopolysaccharide export system protein LptA